MRLRSLLVVGLVLSSSTQAKDNSKDAAIVACEMAAFKEYNAANVALLQASIPLTVDGVLAQRRLEERYCVEAAQCDLASVPHSPLFPTVLGASVSECLADIAKERADLVK